MPSPVYIMIQGQLPANVASLYPPPRESEVVTLPNATGPIELIRLAQPGKPRRSWTHALVLYDTGSQTTTGPLDLTKLDHRSRPAVTQPVKTIGFHSTKEVRYEHIEVLVHWTKNDQDCLVSIPVNCLEVNGPGLLKQLLSGDRGESLRRTPGWHDNVPLIVMGQDLARFHPIDLGEERVPKKLHQLYPKAMWKESRITGGIIPWGNLQRPKPINVALNYMEFSLLCTPLITQARRMKMAQDILELTTFSLLPQMGLRYRPLRPEFVVTNLQILFRGLKYRNLRRLGYRKRYLEEPVRGVPDWEAEEDAFVDWFGLRKGEPRPQTYGAYYIQLTDMALRHWYRKAIEAPVEPLFIGQKWDKDGGRWEGYLTRVGHTPGHQRPHEDNLVTWDSMDNLRLIHPPPGRTLCQERSCALRKALDGTGLY